jgi:hypothetical protein
MARRKDDRSFYPGWPHKRQPVIGLDGWPSERETQLGEFQRRARAETSGKLRQKAETQKRVRGRFVKRD